jgi:HSP20 family protein
MANIMRYHPNASSLISHRDEFVTSFDRVFNQLFESVFPETSKELGVDLFSKGTYPKVNVIDAENEVIIEAEVPGMTKQNLVLDINHRDRILTIKGEKRKEEQNEKRGKFIYRELKQSSFQRSFQLNDNLDAEKIKAKFENGILELTIPKKVPESKFAETKQIQIE